MAVNKIEILLVASNPNGNNVARADFIDKLDLSDQEREETVELVHDEGVWHSSFVVICRREFDLRITEDSNDMDSFYGKQDVYKRVVEWLDRRRVESLKSCQEGGLSVRLMVRIDMSQDQMDLEFPSQFVTSCCRLGLPIMIISNDF